MTNISVVCGRVEEIEADAIVNAANEQLKAGGGVCGAIFARAGVGLLQSACNKVAPCPVGEARIRPLLDPLPEMEDAIRLLLHYNLYSPRLSFTKGWCGGDPYQDMHFLYDGIKKFGRGIFDYIRE